METMDHFVEFDKYCKTCKFRDKNDKKGEEPSRQAVRTRSHGKAQGTEIC